jgi:hypothetical protein
MRKKILEDEVGVIFLNRLLNRQYANVDEAKSMPGLNKRH